MDGQRITNQLQSSDDMDTIETPNADKTGETKWKKNRLIISTYKAVNRNSSQGQCRKKSRSRTLKRMDNKRKNRLKRTKVQQR
ncbi:hypothetical protein Ddc_09923 [Ditylenchus destructor]|nr:hypothetical protein Ddc_09923 [Ditylenchus destructor]